MVTLEKTQSLAERTGFNQNVLEGQRVTYIRKRNLSGTKREKLTVTAKDEHFNSCSLAEEKSWGKRKRGFNDEYLV